MSDTCQHINFNVDVKVGRITDGESGPVTNYVAEVNIKCVDCGTPFHFIGVDSGFGFLRPTRNFVGTTLHVPIAPGESLPETGRLTYDMQGAGTGGRQ